MTPVPLWRVPEGGTQSECAAAQLQHNIARAVRSHIAEQFTSSLREFCRDFGIEHSRLRKVLTGEAAMTFEDVGMLMGRLGDIGEGWRLVEAFAEPVTYRDVETEIIKTWKAPTATVETWAAARGFLDHALPDLIAHYMTWVPRITVTADQEPTHADQPAAGYVNTQGARLSLYLDDNWKTEVFDEGFATHEIRDASDEGREIDPRRRLRRPVLSVNRDAGTVRVLDLDRIGAEEYAFVVVEVQRADAYLEGGRA